MTEIDRTVRARLERDGQRYTARRRDLVGVLARGEGPLTIPEILRLRPQLAQSSVYRNLAILERSGIVRRIVTTGEWSRYELAEDLTQHHHHLICSSCGLVRDFTVSARFERALDATLSKVAGDAGFTVDHHRLDLVGVCGDCG